MVKYTSADVRKVADNYREWARRRDREQFLQVRRAQIQAHYELRNHELKARTK